MKRSKQCTVTLRAPAHRADAAGRSADAEVPAVRADLIDAALAQGYTLSKAALAQRRAASARAAEARPAGREWKTLRVPAELAARIEAAREDNGDDAAWRTVERAVDRAFPF